MDKGLYDILTLQEASDLWKKDDSTLRRVLRGPQFKEGSDYRKTGKVWLIRKESMERVYGEIKSDDVSANKPITGLRGIFSKFKEKKKYLDELSELNHMEFKLSTELSNMLYPKKYSKSLETHSSIELELAYDEFYKSLNDNGKGRLGSLWSIDEKIASSNNGLLSYFIRYREFAVKEGFTHEDYNNLMKEYEITELKAKRLETFVKENFGTFN